MIYLDSAATTLQKPPEVAMAVSMAIGQTASVGRGGYDSSARAGDICFQCREEVAALFHVPHVEQVVFTFNATHGLNIAIKSLVKEGSTVLISGWEHNAVTRPLHGIKNVTIKVAKANLFDKVGAVEAFSRQLTEDVDVVICTHISNVFGFILPIEEIAELCKAHNVPFIIDASQSAGCQPLDFTQLGANFIAMPGHKGLFGPQGTGLLLCGAIPDTLIEGGTGSESRQQTMPSFLPDRLEAGTQNVHGIAGLLEGVRYVRRHSVETIKAIEHGLMHRTVRALKKIENVELFLSHHPDAQSGVLSFRVAGWDCEELNHQLSQRGISLRAGLHCAPLAHDSGGTLGSGTLRISVSPFNTAKEIDQFVKILKEIIVIH